MAKTVEIVYPVCCGMDVHKSFLVACVAVTDEHSHTEHHIRRFSTFTGDLRRLCDWLTSYNCRDVCMESSGKYWIPVFNVLEKTCNVCLTHPKYVKAIKGKKTDKKDAKWISELFKCDLVRSSFIPPPDIRQLRDLCRYYVKLTGFVSGEKNRAQNCLTMCNFKLDDVFTDVFGKSATRVLDALLEYGNGAFELDGLISAKCKSSPEKIRAALDGELDPMQAEKLSVIRRHMDCIRDLQVSLEKLIYELAGKYQPQIDLLMTVPGISTQLTAIRILAEIGADMSVFETAKQLASWAGLTPQNQESAGKKKTTRIGRAGAYLKPLLVQIALNCGKSLKCPELKNKYLELKKRRGGKKAVIAIARKLLTAIWHILSKNEVYSAKLYRKADKPPAARELTMTQAITFLRSKGFLILDEESGEVL
ncbi:IS110 family transposase [Acetanaerobacterium elongatum]|uniref:Transposase IS116/IS110/IS902 family protein n=5 Tax=Acetanaerobacterium elongatum TaxID=258515 RepID=A0A1H0HBR1_9FIRM|nr:IS110 family transposase [Acetanaerobacterium elongatum]SDO16646.1 Transposase IS116/IS110/IS902 family protein [Acetanaerobacterium elongatum]